MHAALSAKGGDPPLPEKEDAGPWRPASPGPPILAALLLLALLMGGLRSPWAWALAAMLLWGLAMHTPPDSRSLPGRWAWAAWLAWTAASALTSPEPLLGAAPLARSMACVLLLHLTAARAGRNERALWFHMFGASGIVLSAAAWALFVPYHPGSGLLYPYYNYTPAVMAALFGASLGAWKVPKDENTMGRRVWIASLLMLSAGIVVWAHSRSGLLALAGISALALWRRGWRRGVLAGALAGTALLAFNPAGLFDPVLKSGHSAAGVRPLIWRAAAGICREDILFGEGPGRFERGFLRHSFAAPEGSWATSNELRATHADSELIQMAAETGVPGLLFFLIAFILTWRKGGSREPPQDWTREAALLACAGLLIQSTVVNIFALPAIGWLFFACLGMGVAGQSAEAAPSRETPSAWPAFGLVLTVLLLLPGWTLSSWRTRAVQAPAGTGVPWMERAIGIAPLDDKLWADLARLHMRGDPPAPLAALAALERAENLNPRFAMYPLIAAEILRSSSHWEAVRILAERVVSLEPYCLQGRLLLAEALHRLGRERDAAEAFEAFAHHRDNPPPRHLPQISLLLKFDPARAARVRGLFYGDREGT